MKFTINNHKRELCLLKPVLVLSLNLLLLNIVYSKNNTIQKTCNFTCQKSEPNDTDFICNESITKIYFQLNNKGQLVCYEETKESCKMINGTHFAKRLFFDEFSEINNISVYGKNGIKINTSTIVTDVLIDGIFHHDTKQLLFETSFSHKNEEFELSYVKRYSDPKFFNRIFFNDIYPISKKTIIVVVPKWIDLEIVEFNFDDQIIEKKTTEIKNAKEITFTVTKLNSISSEGNSVGAAKIYPHLIFIVRSFRNKEKDINVLRNTDDLYLYYNSLVNSVNNESDKLVPIVQNITSDCETEICKIEKLFYWVQDNIRYIAFENGIMGFKPEGAYSVYYNKYGDCKGKANLLKEMLVIAGFDAQLGWLGTSSIPYDYSIPSLVVDNHMICVLYYDDKNYFLDPTEEYIPINEYADRIAGRQVMYQNKDSYIIDTVPNMQEGHNKVEKSFKLELNGNKLTGTAQLNYFGEERTGLLRSYHYSKINDRDKLLELFISNYDKNTHTFNLHTKNLDNRAQPIEIEYELVVSNKVTEVDSLVYVSIDFDRDYADLKIDTLRQSDFNLFTTRSLMATIIIEFSDTLCIEFIPPPVKITTENFVFDLYISVSGNNIIYTKNINIINPIISKSNFIVWNTAIKQLKNFYKNQIILKKK